MKDKIFITGGSGFIGTNLIELLIDKGYDQIVNFDKAAPVKKAHAQYWIEGNMMIPDQLVNALVKAEPSVFIHLAARTDTLSDVLADYDENITGTQNVLDAIKQVGNIKRLIMTSTQYVYKSDVQVYPSNDVDFKPHTIYGQSKVLTEEYTRAANLNCTWAIVRPTNIWGPWHMRYPNELWKVIDKGMYFHPVKDEVIRTYGYVKNIVHQMYEIMIAPVEKINAKVFYVGDAPIDSYIWLNELSMQMTGKQIKRLPKNFFSIIALIGDKLRAIKVPFPLYSERFKNMIESYPAPTHITIELFGVAEADLKKNVSETLKWLGEEGKPFFAHWKNK
jgi:nucleoside-diphosphate-sugar epimerase